MRKLHEIFNAAKAHHYHWRGGNNSQYMCHALDEAQRAGAIFEEEVWEAKRFAQDLVESFNPDSISLAGALSMYCYTRGIDPDMCWHDVAGMVWETVIDKLVLEDK